MSETDGQFDLLEMSWLQSRPGNKWSSYGPDVLPAWVADMDFPTPPAVRQGLQQLLDGADLGYPTWSGKPTPLRQAFSDRMSARYGWQPDPSQVREISDIIQGAQLALHLCSEPGDAVALHVPAYPPFLSTIADMGRRLVAIPMQDGPDGWSFDLERAEAEIAAAGCRVLVVVNPQNPTGRVFSAAELSGLAEIARQRDLVVISDEVWAELAYEPHRHIPFASISPEVAARTVTLTSATKAFSLAGIRCALAHIGPPSLLRALDAQPSRLYGDPNIFGVAATLAAWNEGHDWLQAVRAYLQRNRLFVAETLAALLPQVGHHSPDATYLAWLDLRAFELGPDPAAVLLEKCRVALSAGADFGPGGEGFARLNFATSRPLLAELFERLAVVLGG